jgi:Alpha-kinase family
MAQVEQQQWKVEGRGRAPTLDHAAMQASFTAIDTVIEEGSDEKDDLEEETNQGSIEPKVFTAAEVAQAFSHFTYWATGRKRLVCDLQGVHDKENQMLRLSDPVIHYWNAYCTERRRVHGLTDRGRPGIADFFATHQCGHLCNLMVRGFKKGTEPARRSRR